MQKEYVRIPAKHQESFRQPDPFVILEIAEDACSRQAFEEACYARKFIYSRTQHKNPMIHPSPGCVFYRVYYSEPAQLWHLGVLFQSKLQQI